MSLIEAQDPSGGDNGRSKTGLTRLTVNLTCKTVDALQVVVAESRDSRTDCINRSVQFMALVHEIAGGDKFVTITGKDGKEWRIPL